MQRLGATHVLLLEKPNYSQEIIEKYQSGSSASDIAHLFACSKQTILSVWRDLKRKFYLLKNVVNLNLDKLFAWIVGIVNAFKITTGRLLNSYWHQIVFANVLASKVQSGDRFFQNIFRTSEKLSQTIETMSN